MYRKRDLKLGFIFKRRFIVLLLCSIVILFTLFYTEHPSVRSIKNIASTIGLIDSDYTLVGITDIKSNDHVVGDEDSNVVLIEYSDFGCLLCAAMQSVFDRIVKDKKIRIVSRYLYAGTSGKYFERAVAAECIANELGEDAYNKYVDFLYESQNSIDNDKDLLAQAIRMGYNADKFIRCFENNDNVKEKILSDSEEGWKLGARGTPYIVVVYKNKPIGISYANEYSAFVDRIEVLIVNENN